MRFRLACLAIIIAGIVLSPQRSVAQTPLQVPDANGLTILARTTIVALNHANRSGNYTVFRALASPAFQQTNTPAKLAGIFANLRSPDLDFGPIVLFNPKFTKPPALNPQRLLRLTGYFPTSPLRINFDLVYQRVGERWQLFGIAVQTAQATAAINPQ